MQPGFARVTRPGADWPADAAGSVRGVAFVNKQSGEEESDTSVGSGQPLDFDPHDPDVVKVHYDVSGWDFDQRAELSAALAEADLPHVWDGDEVVVPEVVEGDVDALFDELERALGPFPIVLTDEEPATEFGLDEWTDEDRAVLTDALIASEVPHRWTGTTVLVATDAEDAVDDLLDAIEAGELMAVGDGESGPPEGALGDIYLAADRLAKDPADGRARTDLLDLHPQVDAKHPPYGMAKRPWASAVGLVGSIVDIVEADGVTANADVDSDIIGVAQQLRSTLRPYV